MVRDTTTTPKAKTSFHSVKFSTDDNIFSASLQVVSHLCFYNKRRFESKVMDNHVNFYIMYHVLWQIEVLITEVTVKFSVFYSSTYNFSTNV